MLQIATGQVSVGTSETQVVASRSNRKELRLFFTGPEIRVGPSGVTFTTGYLVPGGSDFRLTNYEGGLSGIRSGGTTVVSYLEIYDDGT